MGDELEIAGSRLTARSLWYEARGRAGLREERLSDLEDGALRVRTLWTGISRGTERLVFHGRVPSGEYQTMRAPFQEGQFPFPVKYGYCAVGEVEAGSPNLLGRTIFCLAPHADRFVVPAASVNVLPAGLPARRASLAANMETALNAVWDSGVGPGDRVVVIGCGLVGLLVTLLCAGIPGADVTAVDVDPSRSEIAGRFGARFCSADGLRNDAAAADVVFHASASPQGLALAIGAAGIEAKIIEMSWYGEGDVPAPLGGAFHSRRLQLISSQVGRVSPGRSPRWSYQRRLAKALQLLCDDRLDALITHEFAFEELPEMLPGFLEPGAPGLAAVVNYSK